MSNSAQGGHEQRGTGSGLCKQKAGVTTDQEAWDGRETRGKIPTLAENKGPTGGVATLGRGRRSRRPLWSSRRPTAPDPVTAERHPPRPGHLLTL